jgi:hypothetical protein
LKQIPLIEKYSNLISSSECQNTAPHAFDTDAVSRHTSLSISAYRDDGEDLADISPDRGRISGNSTVAWVFEYLPSARTRN